MTEKTSSVSYLAKVDGLKRFAKIAETRGIFEETQVLEAIYSTLTDDGFLTGVMVRLIDLDREGITKLGARKVNPGLKSDVVMSIDMNYLTAFYTQGDNLRATNVLLASFDELMSTTEGRAGLAFSKEWFIELFVSLGEGKVRELLTWVVKAL